MKQTPYISWKYVNKIYSKVYTSQFHTYYLSTNIYKYIYKIHTYLYIVYFNSTKEVLPKISPVQLFFRVTLSQYGEANDNHLR